MSGVRRGCWEGWLQEVCKMIKIALTFQALTRVKSDMFCWQKIFKKKSPLKHNGDFTKREVRFLQQWFIQMGHSTSLAWV